MAFQIKKLPDEPILIITIDLPMERHLAEFRVLCGEIGRLVDEAPGPVYRILDLRGEDIAFSDILLGIAEHSGNQSGSLIDPRTRLMMVGTHAMIPVAVRKIKQKLDVDVPWFMTLHEALTYNRSKITRVQCPPYTANPSA
jgi:hypothetical protein